MIDRKNTAGEPGFFNLYTLGVAAIAVCATGVAVLLTPAEATSKASSTATYEGPTSYLPAELVNQATEIEPMPEMYD